MYHSVIGKRLVECVNRREGTEYTVREFFDAVYIPLFFGSARLMQYINNSPFDQAIGKQKKVFSDELIKECLRQVHDKAQGQEPDASFFLGGPASGSIETTSGQVTSLKIPVFEEDVYASWIGAALGLTVQGGLALLIDAEEVLLTTYDGWLEYRKFLDQTPKMKPLQINTWNGQWVANRMAHEPRFDPIADKEGAALTTQAWVQLLFAISFYYSATPTFQLTAYVYSLGQSNTTLGFVRLNLPEVRLPFDLYRQLFKFPDNMSPKRFLSLYDTEMSFRRACESTQIGLRALEPKDLFNARKGIPKKPNNTEGEKQIAFDTYQTWIIAMLNNKELLQKSEELAEALNQFSQQGERGKKVNTQMVDQLLQKKNRREFIEGLTEILLQDTDKRELFEQTVSDILALSPDNVPLFLTLLRFKYAVVKAKA